MSIERARQPTTPCGTRALPICLALALRSNLTPIRFGAEGLLWVLAVFYGASARWTSTTRILLQTCNAIVPFYRPSGVKAGSIPRIGNMSLIAAQPRYKFRSEGEHHRGHEVHKPIASLIPIETETDVCREQSEAVDRLSSPTIPAGVIRGTQIGSQSVCRRPLMRLIRDR